MTAQGGVLQWSDTRKKERGSAAAAAALLLGDCNLLSLLLSTRAHSNNGAPP